MITGKNFIGSNRSNKGTKTYSTFNPLLNINNESIYFEATQEEIDEAVSLAEKAFKSYRNATGKQKADF